MKLIELIINIFRLRWDDNISIDKYSLHGRTTFLSFIHEVLHKYSIIDIMQKEYGPKIKFGLYGHNSLDYISTFVALILKNVDFYLIPVNLRPLLVSGIITNADINIIFTNTDYLNILLINKMHGYPCFKSIYDIKEEEFIYNKSKELNKENIKSDKICFVQDDITSILEIAKKEFKKRHKDREICVFSSGTEEIYPKASYFYDDEICEGITKLSLSDLLPVLQNKSVYSEIPFSYAPVWLILWPLVDDAYFTFSPIESDIIIHDTFTFEEVWNFVSKRVYDIRWIGKLMLKSTFSWLFNIIMKYNIRKEIHLGNKKEAIIILNSTLSPRIISIITKSLPLYTTYGMQELNQILSVNNYSTKSHKKLNCVGEVFEGIQIGIKEYNIQFGEGSLMVASNHYCNNIELSKDIYYDTEDHASLNTHKDTTLLHIFGKTKYAIRNSPFDGSNYENLERLLKNIPFFKEVYIKYIQEKDDGEASIDRNLHIFVYPNISILEINKMGYIDFSLFIKQYKNFINTRYGIDFVKSVVVVYNEFIHTHNNKLHKGPYDIIEHSS